MLEEFESELTDLTLIPSRGGVYEIEVNGRLIYSKRATGKHIEHDEALRLVRDARANP